MYTIKRLSPQQEATFINTDKGSENRDEAIMLAMNLASEEAKEKRVRVYATKAYLGHITFIVSNSKKWFGGYAVCTKED